jgi:hypothetical protein
MTGFINTLIYNLSQSQSINQSLMYPLYNSLEHAKFSQSSLVLSWQQIYNSLMLSLLFTGWLDWTDMFYDSQTWTMINWLWLADSYLKGHLYSIWVSKEMFVDARIHGNACWFHSQRAGFQESSCFIFISLETCFPIPSLAVDLHVTVWIAKYQDMKQWC